LPSSQHTPRPIAGQRADTLADRQCEERDRRSAGRAAGADQL